MLGVTINVPEVAEAEKLAVIALVPEPEAKVNPVPEYVQVYVMPLTLVTEYATPLAP